MSLFGPSRNQIKADPCLQEIIKFFRAVRGIPEKSQFTQSWADIYDNKGTIVCRFYENDRSTTGYLAEQIEVYGQDNEVINQMLYKSINGANLPKDTQIVYGEKYEDYQLFYTAHPKYPNALKKYADIIAELCEENNIPLGNVGKNRVYLSLD